MTVTGKTLIDWGYTPGPWFKDAIAAANTIVPYDRDAVIYLINSFVPPPRVGLNPAGRAGLYINIRADAPGDEENIAMVKATMTELLRTPPVLAGAIMPDACPTGAIGTIPVGGVAVTVGTIHPGFHSADVCCSMAISVIPGVEPAAVMDAAMKVTHFGPGGRPDAPLPSEAILCGFKDNPFLSDLLDKAISHHCTQGDGNHFFFVGRLKSTGDVAIVTHHGSRGPGAMLYKRGMAAATRHTARVAEGVLPSNVWMDLHTPEGQDYWDALQVIRNWTKSNHFTLHDMVCERLDRTPIDRFWNEHNFVFRRGGYVLHGKGATPGWEGFAADNKCGRTLVPLNMGAPILITHGSDAPHALGFLPHGAGRNWGRREHVRRLGGEDPAETLARETVGLDVRFWSGVPDLSELPSAYKSAATVRGQIEEFGLARIVDEVIPYGTIMAGSFDHLRRK